MHQKFLQLLFSLLMPLLSLFAQNEQGSHVFQAIAAGEGIVNTLWYNVGGEKALLSASSIFRSKDYSYDAGPSIIFYGDRVDDEGQPIPEAIAQVPPGATRLLLLFHKLKDANSQEGLAYNIITLPDSSTDFEFGSFQFINATKSELAIELGGERFFLPPSAINIVRIDTTGSVHLQIVGQDVDDNWKPFYSNSWGHRPDMRTLVFIVNNEDGGISTLRYRQFEPKK